MFFHLSAFAYNTHGHKLRFPAFEKAQFVTECGIKCKASHQPQSGLFKIFTANKSGMA
jgi:hypothetical protein